MDMDVMDVKCQCMYYTYKSVMSIVNICHVIHVNVMHG